MKYKVDVLNLEWTSRSSRDRDASSLVTNYLRLQGYNVVEKSIHNGIYYILRFRPRCVYISNIIGAKINFACAILAKSMGIRLITGLSEGDLNEDKVINLFYGHNYLSKPIEDALLVWNENVKNLILKHHPSYNSKVFVTGSLTADKYKFKDIPSPPQLDKVRHKYKYVIGVGCWAFRYYFDRKDIFTLEQIQSRQTDRDIFAKGLYDLISKKNDYLFLIKTHPGEKDIYYGSGIEQIKELDNTVIYSNDENITQIINSTDLWLTYESTTALEAWLLGKETLVFNPTGLRRDSSQILRAQMIVRDSKELMHEIEYFFNKGELAKSNSLNKKRDKIINNVIGYPDGYNHERVSKIIAEYLDKEIAANDRISLIHVINAVAYWLKYAFTMKIKARYRWHDNEIEDINDRYIKHLEVMHQL